MAKKFDDILTKVGNYNKFQKLLIFWVIGVAFFFMGFKQLWVFITIKPKDYWCHVQGRERTNLTEEKWKSLTIPSQGDKLDKCHQYDVHFEGEKLIVSRDHITACSNWDHNLIAMKETISTSKGWFCDKEIYSTHILAVGMFGNCIGSAVLPILADKTIGRRRMFFVCALMIGLFSLTVLFVDNIWIILVARFLAGTGFHAAYQLPLIISLELISPDKRAFISFLSFFTWTVGSTTNGLFAWLTPYWQTLTLWTCLPYLGFLLLWRLLPESPRYLLARQRYEECADILMRVASTNKRELDREDLLKDLKCLPKDEGDISLREILHYPRMILLLIIMSCISFSCYLLYMTVIYNVKVLPDNIFLGNFVISVTELPSNLIGLFFAHYFGRKATSILGGLLLIPFLAAGPFFVNNPDVMLALGSLMKVFATIVAFSVYVITPELFPTPVRSSVLGVVVLSGMVAVSISPYLITLENSSIYWVILGFGLLILLLSFALTETIGFPLPQTFREAENHIQSRPLFIWIHHWNHHLYKPKEKEEAEVWNPLS